MTRRRSSAKAMTSEEAEDKLWKLLDEIACTCGIPVTVGLLRLCERVMSTHYTVHCLGAQERLRRDAAQALAGAAGPKPDSEPEPEPDPEP